MNFYTLPMDFNDFEKWYEELGKLKIFWAKPLSELKLKCVRPSITTNFSPSLT